MTSQAVLAAQSKSLSDALARIESEARDGAGRSGIPKGATSKQSRETSRDVLEQA
jgi:hypothetical protein